jgi:hypothetical protein
MQNAGNDDDAATPELRAKCIDQRVHHRRKQEESWRVRDVAVRDNRSLDLRLETLGRMLWMHCQVIRKGKQRMGRQGLATVVWACLEVPVDSSSDVVSVFRHR